MGPRLDSVDTLRGIIMVVMALDHTREFLTYLTFSPENLANTWPALFFTRWITHFCAPLFFFLAGTGAYLARMRGRSVSNLSHFLWTRGLWLVARRTMKSTTAASPIAVMIRRRRSGGSS